MDLSQLVDNYLKKGFTPELAVETAKSELQSINDRDARNTKREADNATREEAEKQRLIQVAESEKLRKVEEEKLKNLKNNVKNLKNCTN